MRSSEDDHEQGSLGLPEPARLGGQEHPVSGQAAARRNAAAGRPECSSGGSRLNAAHR